MDTSPKTRTRRADGLTYRQVVELTNRGWTRPEIAAALDVSTTTIGYHKRRARERGDLVVRLPLPEPAPAPAPRTLTIQLPVGVSVEVVQAQPAADLAFVT